MRKEILKILGVSPEGKENAGSANQAKTGPEARPWYAAAGNLFNEIARKTAVAATQAAKLISDDPVANAIDQASELLQESDSDQLSSYEQRRVVEIFLDAYAKFPKDSVYKEFNHLLYILRTANGNNAYVINNDLINALRTLKSEDALGDDNFIAVIEAADPLKEVDRIVSEEIKKRAQVQSQRESSSEESVFAEQDRSFEDDSAFTWPSKPVAQPVESLDEGKSSELENEILALEEKGKQILEFREKKDFMKFVLAAADWQKEYKQLKAVNKINAGNAGEYQTLEELSSRFSSMGKRLAELSKAQKNRQNESSRESASMNELSRSSEDMPLPPTPRDSSVEMDRSTGDEASEDLSPPPTPRDSTVEMGRSSVDDSSEDLGPPPEPDDSTLEIEDSEDDKRAQAFERKHAEVTASLNKNPPLQDKDKNSIGRVLKTVMKIEQVEAMEKRIQKLQGESLKNFVKSLQQKVDEAGLHTDAKGSLNNRLDRVLDSKSTMEKRYERLLEIGEEIADKKNQLDRVRGMKELINVLPSKFAQPFLDRLDKLSNEIKEGKDVSLEVVFKEIIQGANQAPGVWNAIRTEIMKAVMPLQDSEKAEILNALKGMSGAISRKSLEALSALKKRVSEAQPAPPQPVKERRQDDDPRADISKLIENYESDKKREAAALLSKGMESDDVFSRVRDDLAEEVLSHVDLKARAEKLQERVGKVNIKKNYEYDMDYIHKELKDLKGKISVLEKTHPGNSCVEDAKRCIAQIDQKIGENEAQRNKSIFTLASEKVSSVIQTVRRDEGKMPTSVESQATSKPNRSPREILNLLAKRIKPEDKPAPKSQPGWVKRAEKTEAEQKLGANKSGGKSK